ncbi:hypothetical protein AAG570_006547 [Ranatra chinensis]|uniref:Uncharacterized protein n=1 Tax=Ranatra chinensis TaxID=642074 RepID=A0ABD0YUB5_9HEMI
MDANSSNWPPCPSTRERIPSSGLSATVADVKVATFSEVVWTEVHVTIEDGDLPKPFRTNKLPTRGDRPRFGEETRQRAMFEPPGDRGQTTLPSNLSNPPQAASPG